MLLEMVYSPVCYCSVATCNQSISSLSYWELLVEMVMVMLPGQDGMMQVFLTVSIVSVGISVGRV